MDRLPLGALTTEPTLQCRSPGRRPSGRAFAVFRRMVIEHASAADVMEEFSINRARVYQLVSRVTKWAREHEGTGDVLAIKVQDTAALEDLYRDVLIQWKRSCQDASINKVSVTRNRFKPDGTPLPDQVKDDLEVRPQTGNPALARLLMDIRASRRGIWGADAPKQVVMPDAPAGTIALAVLLNASSRTPAPPHDPSEPLPNVIDVEAELAKLEAHDGPGAA